VPLIEVKQKEDFCLEAARHQTGNTTRHAHRIVEASVNDCEKTLNSALVASPEREGSAVEEARRHKFEVPRDAPVEHKQKRRNACTTRCFDIAATTLQRCFESREVSAKRGTFDEAKTNDHTCFDRFTRSDADSLLSKVLYAGRSVNRKQDFS
jgi:hypothetical protein